MTVCSLVFRFTRQSIDKPIVCLSFWNLAATQSYNLSSTHSLTVHTRLYLLSWGVDWYCKEIFESGFGLVSIGRHCFSFHYLFDPRSLNQSQCTDENLSNLCQSNFSQMINKCGLRWLAFTFKTWLSHLYSLFFRYFHLFNPAPAVWFNLLINRLSRLNYSLSFWFVNFEWNYLTDNYNDWSFVLSCFVPQSPSVRFSIDFQWSPGFIILRLLFITWLSAFWSTLPTDQIKMWTIFKCATGSFLALSSHCLPLSLFFVFLAFTISASFCSLPFPTFHSTGFPGDWFIFFTFADISLSFALLFSDSIL